MHGSPRDLHPFRISGYEIFDDDFVSTGEVVIWARSATPPKAGELFNIQTAGRLHELCAGEVRTFKGGWMAICRAEHD